MEIEVLVPVSPLQIQEQPLAPRLGDLRGRRIGFLDNQKANAGLLLDQIAAGLLERAGPFEAVREAKVATGPAPAAVMGRLENCHAVVLAIAD